MLLQIEKPTVSSPTVHSAELLTGSASVCMSKIHFRVLQTWVKMLPSECISGSALQQLREEKQRLNQMTWPLF